MKCCVMYIHDNISLSSSNFIVFSLDTRTSGFDYEITSLRDVHLFAPFPLLVPALPGT